MKPAKLFLLTSTIVYLGISVFFSYRIFQVSHEFKEYRNSTAATLDSKDRLTSITEWGRSLPGLRDIFSKSDRMEKSETSESEALRCYECVLKDAVMLGGISFLYLLMVFFMFRKTTYLFKYLGLGLTVVSVVFLVLGVATPILEIGAYKDMLNIPIKFNFGGKDYDWSPQFDGRMYFFYNIKSIMGVITLLFENGNIVVGGCILLFSVIMPVTKLACTFIVIFSNRYKKNRVLNFVVQYLGKWSMADVFVVSIFLGYLSFQNMSTGVDTEANTLIGLYFFLGFVISSLLSSTFLKIQQNKEKKETVLIK